MKASVMITIMVPVEVELLKRDETNNTDGVMMRTTKEPIVIPIIMHHSEEPWEPALLQQVDQSITALVLREVSKLITVPGKVEITRIPDGGGLIG